MLENVYDSLLTIFADNWPKDEMGRPVVYGRVIGGWKTGDRTVVGADTLAIVLQGETSPANSPAFMGGYEVEHTIAIKMFAKGDNAEIDERTMQEMSRIAYEILLPHRRMWVMTLCPLCLKETISPLHLQIEHSTFLADYVAAVDADFAALWHETHAQDDAVPTIPASGRYVDALYRYWEAIRASSPTNPLPPTERNVRSAQAKIRRPVRLMYDMKISTLNTSSGGAGTKPFCGTPSSAFP